MLRGFFGNLIFAIIARMLYGNHLNCIVRLFLFKEVSEFTIHRTERHVNFFETQGATDQLVIYIDHFQKWRLNIYVTDLTSV